jgi:hypothetical protein
MYELAEEHGTSQNRSKDTNVGSPDVTALLDDISKEKIEMQRIEDLIFKAATG